eukprot:scaffold179478_cov19-Tisochrysis_lutea.AAC.1
MQQTIPNFQWYDHTMQDGPPLTRTLQTSRGHWKDIVTAVGGFVNSDNNEDELCHQDSSNKHFNHMIQEHPMAFAFLAMPCASD